MEEALPGNNRSRAQRRVAVGGRADSSADAASARQAGAAAQPCRRRRARARWPSGDSSFYLHVSWGTSGGRRGERRATDATLDAPSAGRKPRRTASGVSHHPPCSTKPRPCSGRRVLPGDIRMPKAIFPTSRPASQTPGAAGSTPSCRWPPVCARPWGTSPTKWSLSCWAAPGATTGFYQRWFTGELSAP